MWHYYFFIFFKFCECKFCKCYKFIKTHFHNLILQLQCSGLLWVKLWPLCGEHKHVHSPQDEGDILDNQAGGHQEAGEKGGWACGCLWRRAWCQARGWPLSVFRHQIFSSRHRIPLVEEQQGLFSKREKNVQDCTF